MGNVGYKASDILPIFFSRRVKFHCVAGASEVATCAMIFWPRRNYYMKEEHHHNNIYVRASMHLLTLITTRIKTFTLSTLAASAQQ